MNANTSARGTPVPDEPEGTLGLWKSWNVNGKEEISMRYWKEESKFLEWKYNYSSVYLYLLQVQIPTPFCLLSIFYT
jgi:hypothetical protein